MRVLYRYLTHYRLLVLVALMLAVVSQAVSLLDPLIYRHIIDRYAMRHDRYTSGEFVRGVSRRIIASSR